MAGEEAELHPAEEVIHDGLGVADLLVAGPAGGLEAGVGELLAEELERDAVLEAEQTAVAKESMRPEMVEPSLAMRTKISPGWPLG